MQTQRRFPNEIHTTSSGMPVAMTRGGQHTDSGYESIGWKEREIKEESLYAREPSDISKRTLEYNDHKVTLLRAISGAKTLLDDLREMRQRWTIQYPSTASPDVHNRPKASRTVSNRPSTSSSTRPDTLKRSTTENGSCYESDNEDRLVPRDVAKQYNVLRLDLRLGNLPPNELMKYLENDSLANLLDDRISMTLRHLEALRLRIEDKMSKVLVTGDLNAGKSTFCNALLRRKLLPEDQQPCTNVFCEVLDAKLNSDVEEVHAITHGNSYDHEDSDTYEVFGASDLALIATETNKFERLKIYLNDKRSMETSLLRNGLVDIALMDAPGLNSDSVKTTAVFARQEEIDIVVFVVSAENHFTLSAKEFLWNAANEKTFIFIVVNRFDNIANKDRCRRLILEQIASLSPHTSQYASELVHFVSANAVIESKDQERTMAFDWLETCLRQFILEKRSTSKLAPAKTFVTNVLADLVALADFNNQVARIQEASFHQELGALQPKLEKLRKRDASTSESIHRTVESHIDELDKRCKFLLSNAFSQVENGVGAPAVPYNGLFSIVSYASETAEAMQGLINSQLRECEEFARSQTVSALRKISSLGIANPNEKIFRPQAMFSRQRLSTINVQIAHTIWDLLPHDWNYCLETAGAGITFGGIAMLTSQIVNAKGWLNIALNTGGIIGTSNLRRLILPMAALSVLAGVAMVINSVPSIVPKNLARKMRAKMASEDIIYKQTTRIGNEVRKVLRIPSEDIRSELSMAVKETKEKQAKIGQSLVRSGEAARFFDDFSKKASVALDSVSSIQLDVVQM